MLALQPIHTTLEVSRCSSRSDDLVRTPMVVTSTAEAACAAGALDRMIVQVVKVVPDSLKMGPEVATLLAVVEAVQRLHEAVVDSLRLPKDIIGPICALPFLTSTSEAWDWYSTDT